MFDRADIHVWKYEQRQVVRIIMFYKYDSYKRSSWKYTFFIFSKIWYTFGIKCRICSFLILYNIRTSVWHTPSTLRFEIDPSFHYRPILKKELGPDCRSFFILVILFNMWIVQYRYAKIGESIHKKETCKERLKSDDATYMISDTTGCTLITRIHLQTDIHI